MTDDVDHPMGERVAVVEALSGDASKRQERMIDALEDLRAISIKSTAALERIEDRLDEGSAKFTALDERVAVLELAKVQFDSTKGVLLAVAAGFGAFITAVAGLLIQWFHK